MKDVHRLHMAEATIIKISPKAENNKPKQVQFQPKDDPESDTSEGPTCLIIIIHIYDYSQLLFISIYK